MSNLKNRVHLIGNLGMNPEIKVLDSGKKFAKFSLATNETYKNAKGEKVTETEWHTIIAWNKAADLAEMFLEKGKEVAIDGKIKTRSWEDEKGNKRYFTEIICNEILFLGSKGAS